VYTRRTCVIYGIVSISKEGFVVGPYTVRLVAYLGQR